MLQIGFSVIETIDLLFGRSCHENKLSSVNKDTLLITPISK